MPRLVAGLGNPGPGHAGDRHNAGFWFVDALARQHGGQWRHESRFQADMARCRIGALDLWLMKPQTFMNRSGQSVGAFCRFHRIEAPDLLVAYDELDFEPGVARLKLGGSSTHNGLRDISASNGGPGYWRLRLGIGHPRDLQPGKPVADFVLTTPPRAQREAIEQAIERSLDVVPLLMAGQWGEATRLLHSQG